MKQSFATLLILVAGSWAIADDKAENSRLTQTSLMDRTSQTSSTSGSPRVMGLGRFTSTSTVVAGLAETNSEKATRSVTGLRRASRTRRSTIATRLKRRSRLPYMMRHERFSFCVPRRRSGTLTKSAFACLAEAREPAHRCGCCAMTISPIRMPRIPCFGNRREYRVQQ